MCPLPLIQVRVTHLGSDSQDPMIACVSCLPVCLPNSNGRTAVITRPQRSRGAGGGWEQRLIVHKSSRSIVSGEPPANVVPMDRRPTCPSTSTVPCRSLWVGGVISGPLRHDASSQSQLKTNSLGHGNGGRFGTGGGGLCLGWKVNMVARPLQQSH